MGYENFGALHLPETQFWSESEQQACRKLPMPKGLDLTAGQHRPLVSGEAQKSSGLSTMTELLSMNQNETLAQSSDQPSSDRDIVSRF